MNAALSAAGAPGPICRILARSNTPPSICRGALSRDGLRSARAASAASPWRCPGPRASSSCGLRRQLGGVQPAELELQGEALLGVGEVEPGDLAQALQAVAQRVVVDAKVAGG